MGKIGTLMDEKGTKLFVRNIIAWEGTFMDKKGTTLLFGMIEKEHKGLKLKVEGTLLGKIGTLMDEKGTKTLNDDWKGTKRPEAYFIISSIWNIIW